MTLVRWSPFREMDVIQSEVNRLFSQFGGFNSDQGRNDRASNDRAKNDRAKNGHDNESQWMLPVDVLETSDAIKFKAALPGVDAKNVEIDVNENVLSLTARREHEENIEASNYHWIEQQYGTFSRSLTLPRYADTEKIEASYQNGILEIIVPKKESSKPRRVQLQTGSVGTRTLEAGPTG